MLVRRAAVLALVGAVALGAAGCGKGCGGGGAAPADAAVVEVAAPADLLAEVVAGAPQSTWAKVQRLLGGTAALLPLSPGGVLVAVAGLDAELGPEIDGVSPAYAAAAGTLDAPRWVVAARLADPRKVRARLAADAGAGAGTTDAGLVRVPSRSRAPDAVAAVSEEGLLLVAPDEASLDALGPYVARTLARRPTPPAALSVHVPRAALAGPLKAGLGAAWARARAFLLASADEARAAHGGRAADLGEPTEVVAALDRTTDGFVATAASLDHVDVTIDLRDDGLRVDGELAPADGAPGDPSRAWIAALRTGTPEPVLRAPADARVAAFVRGDVAARSADARAIGESVAKALGPRLAAPERERLDAALVAFAGARGEGTTAAWVTGEGYGGVGVALAADKPAVAATALRDLVAAASAPAALRELARVKTVTVREVDVPPFGKGNVAVAEPDERTPAGHAGRPSARAPRVPELAWAAAGDVLVAAVGDDPARLVRAFGHGGVLGEHAATARVVRALGADVALVVVGRPPLRGVPADEAPVVLSVRRDAAAARAALDVPTAWLRAMAPRLGGL